MTLLHLIHFFGLDLLSHTCQLHVKFPDFVHFLKFILVFDSHFVTFLNLIQSCFNLGCDRLVLNLRLKKFGPELVTIVLLHLLHSPQDLFIATAFTNRNEVVRRFALLVDYYVHNVVKLSGQPDVGVGCVYLGHEVIEFVHDVVLHLLQFLYLCIDVIQSIDSGFCIEQHLSLSFFFNLY